MSKEPYILICVDTDKSEEINPEDVVQSGHPDENGVFPVFFKDGNTKDYKLPSPTVDDSPPVEKPKKEIPKEDPPPPAK